MEARSRPSPRCFERGEGKSRLVGTRERGLCPRAFTLLELILVISVVALAAALTVPMLGRFSHGRRDTDAVAQFLAVIQYAQDEAANSATPYRVQLDANSQTYGLTMLEAGDYVKPHNDFGQTFTLPDTLTASWDSPPDIAQRGYIQFEDRKSVV